MHLSFIKSVILGAAVFFAAVPKATADCPNCPSPCVAGDSSEAFHYPHCSEVDKFIQCSEFGECFEMPCAPGTVWDDDVKTCNFASAVCSSGDCSDCFTVSDEAGCECDPCEDVVCNDDPFCCNVKWDAFCVSEAADLCEPLCLAPVCDSSECSTCTSPTFAAGCDCEPCESLVCEIDFTCCLPFFGGVFFRGWDIFCVLIADQFFGFGFDVCGPFCPSSDADSLPMTEVAPGAAVESAGESAAYDCTEMFDYAITSKSPTDDFVSAAPLAVFSTDGTLAQSWEDVDDSSNRIPLPPYVKCALEEIDEDGLYDVSVTMESDLMTSLGMDTSEPAIRMFVLLVNSDD